MVPNPSPNSSAIRKCNQSDLERKRARDRKAQQAMRDRNKWTLQYLTDQVSQLSVALDEETQQIQKLNARIQSLETENDHLRVENAALQLSLLGEPNVQNSPSTVSVASSPCAVPAWEIVPLTVPPTCLSDQILQGVLESRQASCSSTLVEHAASYMSKPNLSVLLNKDQRSDDEISNVVGDIVRSYTEIETLPKQVAVHFIMSVLLKWQLLRDEKTWNEMPAWLRPEPIQLTTPHAAWIDRIPWPKARVFLVSNPHIHLDDFAAVYSSSFDIQWNYDPSNVLISTGTGEVFVNPIYEEHIRHLRNWTVGEAFKKRFPVLAQFIDEYQDCE